MINETRRNETKPWTTMSISRTMKLLNLKILLQLSYLILTLADFPYTLSIINDGPVLFDTPVSIKLTLVPTKSETTTTAKNDGIYVVKNRSDSSFFSLPSSLETVFAHHGSPETPKKKKFYFDWIDGEGLFDCPHRIVAVSQPSPLVSVYNVTYHYQWLKCPPPFTQSRRTVGVQVFDDPNFDPDWDTPLGQMETEFVLVRRLVGNLTARQCTLDVDAGGEESTFLARHPVAFSSLLHDPSGTLARGNVSYVWRLSPNVGATIPPVDMGPAFVHNFDAPGLYDVSVFVTVFMERPRYPKSSNLSVIIEKTGEMKKTVSMIEQVNDLRLTLRNMTVPLGELFNVNVSVYGTFPLTVNWTIDYVSPFGILSPYPASDGASTSKNVATCRRANSTDFSSHHCLICVADNFTTVGAYRLTVFAANRLSHAKKRRYFWVYSTDHSTTFIETIIFPLVFVVIALLILVFGYVRYLKLHTWMNRSLEVADFEFSYSYSSVDGGGGNKRRVSWKSWAKDLCGRYADWVRSLAEAPNVPKKPHLDADTLSKYYPKRRRVKIMEIVKSLPFKEAPPQPQLLHERVDEAEEEEEEEEENIAATSAHANSHGQRLERQSYIRLKTREELGFYDADYDHVHVEDVDDDDDDEIEEEEIVADFEIDKNSYQNASLISRI